MDDCSYCHGVRLVGWSGAGPILCPTCSSGADAFTVITHAWREQRKRAIEAENERDRLRSALQVAEQKNTELVAETWKLGTEIEERAIEQARLREALQVAERERDGARAELERDQEFMVRVAQERDEARANVGELRAEVERLRGALAWYADPNQWNGYYGNTDNGKRAREALGK